jgi:hypothetical protein
MGIYKDDNNPTVEELSAAINRRRDSETTLRQKDSIFLAIKEEMMELEDSGLQVIDLEDLRKAHRAIRERNDNG